MKNIIKKLFGVLLVLGLGFTLVACNNDKKPEVQDKEDEIVDVEVKTLIFDKEISKDTWETVSLDVKDYDEVVITIKDKSNYDLPLNIDNFKVDGEEVEYKGLSGSSYLHDHEFTIGDLKAIGHNVNTHQGNIRLHTTQSNKRVEHYIKIDVSDINTLEFQYKVTTNAFSYLEAVVVELNKVKE